MKQQYGTIMPIHRYIGLICRVICLLPLLFYYTSAQQTPPTAVMPTQEIQGFRFGVYGHAVRSMHEAFFYHLPYEVTRAEDISKFPFGNGSGWNLAGGVLAEISLAKTVTLGLRGGYVGHNATLLSPEDFSAVGRLDGSFDDNGTFQRTFEARLASIGTELLFGFTPFSRFTFFVGGRGEWAITKTFTSYEALTNPTDGVFKENGLRTRDQKSGTLPDVRNMNIANFNLSLLVGVGYEFSVTPSAAWTVAPEVFYSRALFSVIQESSLQPGESWRAHAIRGGLAFRFYPERAAAFNAQDYKLQQLMSLEKQIASERLVIQEQLRELRQTGVSIKLLNLRGLTTDDKEVLQPTLKVEQFTASNTVQLLPYIFFNENSFVFPARYHRMVSAQRGAFRLESLARLQPVQIYHRILDIIGKRLTDNPAAKITLVGCNANTGTEKGNRKLSRMRAESVADYLQDVWKIPQSRMQISDRDLPEQAATGNSSEAQAENRRVEILSDTPAILAPFYTETIHPVVNPPALAVDLQINAGTGLKQWALEFAKFEGRESKTLRLAEGAQDYPRTYIWRLNDDLSVIPLTPGSIDVSLDVTDVDNRNTDAPLLSVPVEVLTVEEKKQKRLPDKTLDMVTLITGANNPATSAMLQRINAKKTARSFVTIDEIPDGSQRAQNLVTALGGGANLKINALKESETTAQRYDLTTPEGRLYSRALRIMIETQR